ncbi:HEAT repeat domain-containing protein [bacterium]|nr:HEAT repeat domain-containing protein [bacterium]
MKNYLLTLCFVLVSILAKADPLEKIYTHVDSALTVLKMEKSDFSMLHTFVKEDSFRLKLIKNLFENPLSTFNVTDSIAKKGFELSTADFLSLVSNLLDVQSSRLPKISQKQQINNSQLPQKLKNELEKLLQTENFIQQTVKESLSQFTEDEQKFIFEETQELLKHAENEEKLDVFTSRENEYKSYESSKRYFELVPKIDLSILFEAYKFQFSVFENLVKVYKASNFSPNKILELETNFGKIAFGTKGNDVFKGNYFLILDCNGSDVYRLSSFGSKTNNFSNTKIFDLSGNDFYETNTFNLACGFFGASFLVDENGDDTYKSASYSQGSGVFGFGILIDKNGNDIFSGDTFVQGAGFFGIGLLYDFSGTDTYKAELYAQGFGSTKGFGAVFDTKGNDFYLPGGKYVDVLRYEERYEFLGQGFGLGFRPLASGGIGILADSSGNDTYKTDIFGQGSAYWFALGGLADFSGNDTFSSHQYAQGSGVHFAFGTLIDCKGIDNYVTFGVSQGCGHDFAFGGLLDLEGDDFYVCNDLSQGGGNANATSFFCDFQGKDGYLQKKTNTLGYSDQRRDFGMIGLFFDLQGEDVYTKLIGKENSVWLHSTYGYGTDKDFLLQQTQQETAKNDSLELETNLERLFVQASTGLIKFQNLVKPAQEKIIALGTEAMPFLVSKLETFSPREALALREIIPKISGAEEFLWKITDEKTSFAVQLLGKIGKENSLPYLFASSKNKNWKIRDETATALGEIKSDKAEQILQQLCKDEIFLVRKSAALSLGKIQAKDSGKLLLELLTDKNQAVRNQAKRSLAMLFDEKIILEKLQGKGIIEQERLLLIEVLELAKEKCSAKSIVELENLLKSESELVRFCSAKALLAINPGSEKLEKFRKAEKNSLARGIFGD